MSQKNATGPCGFSLAEIIAKADKFGKYAATFGITDPELLNEFCVGLGEALTEELTLPAQTTRMEAYAHRLRRVSIKLIDTFSQTEYWPMCAALGPYTGPSSNNHRHRDAAPAFFYSFRDINKALKVPTSEVLELLAWIQCVLAVRVFCAENPELASMNCGPAGTVDKPGPMLKQI